MRDLALRAPLKNPSRESASSVLVAVSAFAVCIRAVQLVLVPWLSMTAAGWRLLHDSFHHYQIGVLMLVVGSILRRKVKGAAAICATFCAGCLIEEHVVLLGDAGIRTKYAYLSTEDSLVVLGLAAALVAVARALTPKGRSGGRPVLLQNGVLMEIQGDRRLPGGSL